MSSRALFLSVDRAMFLPAVFTAHTAIANARAHDFDTFIAVPENSVEPAWIDWAQQIVGVTVKEAPLVESVGLAETALTRLPPSTAYRFFFDLFLPSRYEKLIYLDADIRVLGDISRLYDLNLRDHPFAASPDWALAAYDGTSENWISDYIAKIGWDTAVTYANPGVLLIDRARWQQLDLSRRVVEHLRMHLDVCANADQSALNRVVRGQFQPISPVWNMMITLVWLGDEPSDVILPAILHYGGPRKPWNAVEWGAKYGPSETVPYHQFFRNSPCPRFAALQIEWRNWRTLRRYFKRHLRWTFTQRSRPPRVLLPGIDPGRYKTHIRTFPFADKAQGLVACDVRGVLGVAG